MIELRDIVRRFGRFQLGPISLDIRRGEYWVLLGPSGAGKSLLLHTVAGLHRADAGEICLSGVRVTTLAPERRRIGMVFQGSALFPHLGVEGNIAYGMRRRGDDAGVCRRRVGELVERLGLGAIVGRPVATLSGGEAQRVAIARALATDPVLLLLDEPLSPIDQPGRRALIEELRRLHRDLGQTILHVTHSHDEARALGDHCGIMRDGALVRSGTLDEVFSLPGSGFVADLLGQ
ncbi:MAG: ATP-binding cassette domain-containing protein [Myxococcota bacterium]